MNYTRYIFWNLKPQIKNIPPSYDYKSWKRKGTEMNWIKYYIKIEKSLIR